MSPVFAAAMGTKDFSVMPGTVFSSRISGSPFSSQIKSTLAQCLHPSALNALTDDSSILLITFSGIFGGQMYLVLSPSYLL